jgi:hypothetical protein
MCMPTLEENMQSVRTFAEEVFGKQKPTYVANKLRCNELVEVGWLVVRDRGHWPAAAVRSRSSAHRGRARPSVSAYGVIRVV